jgi:hypothetical protein
MAIEQYSTVGERAQAALLEMLSSFDGRLSYLTREELRHGKEGRGLVAQTMREHHAEAKYWRMELEEMLCAVFECTPDDLQFQEVEAAPPLWDALTLEKPLNALRIAHANTVHQRESEERKLKRVVSGNEMGDSSYLQAKIVAFMYAEAQMERVIEAFPMSSAEPGKGDTKLEGFFGPPEFYDARFSNNQLQMLDREALREEERTMPDTQAPMVGTLTIQDVQAAFRWIRGTLVRDGLVSDDDAARRLDAQLGDTERDVVGFLTDRAAGSGGGREHR